MSLTYIAVNTNKDGSAASSFVKEKYDHTIPKESYAKKDASNNPIAYTELKSLLANNDQKFVVVSEDRGLVVALPKRPNTTTLYISNDPILYPHALGNTGSTNDIIFFGVDSDVVSEQTQDAIDKSQIIYFTVQKLKKRPLSEFVSTIKKMLTLSSHRLCVIIDIAVIDKDLAPCAKRQPSQKNYLTVEDINNTITQLKSFIHMLVILGFDVNTTADDEDPAQNLPKLTGYMCKTMIRNAFDIKEKSLNVFTEDSRFLIYRPVKQIYNTHKGEIQEAYDPDIGWYILRFMTLKEREEVLKLVMDKVITIPLNNLTDDDDQAMEIFVTSTTINEQNNKSFYNVKSMFDYCLYPKEKLSMVCELLNSSSNSLEAPSNSLEAPSSS